MNRIMLTLPLALLTLAAPAHPQTAAPAAMAPAAAEETINAARQILAERYVLPETAEQLDAALAKALAAGRFNGLQGEALADAINVTLREVTPDGHLSVSYNPARAAMLSSSPQPDDTGGDEIPPQVARMIERMNGGVNRLEVLPGNIRYLDYRGFMWGTPAAEQALATAMEFLRGGDAIIIDLRKNGGGSPTAVATLASYFLPPETKLMRFEMRGMPGEASETRAAPFSLAGKPAYVLTSKQSFSAAEEFAAHVDAFDFATLVGETTGGGGFRNTFFALPGGQVMSVSIGRAVHMVTGKDWEGTGIAPAIEVPAERALARAQAEAMSAIAAAAPERERAGAQRLAAFYRAQAEPADPGAPAADYAGTYGPRVLAVDPQGNLTTRRGEQPAVRLVAVGPDLFAVEAAPTQQFRFVREGGAVVALEVDGPNGEPQRSPRG